ncbi:taurine dioxygenase [Acephala macrosclerotiorum]|nr:taurine dioxygenase [Acephala macrosclerotiorum]
MAPSAAPSATDPTKPTIAQARPIPGPKSFNKELELNGNDKYPAAKYPNYLPTWDPDQHDPPLEPFEHIEHGKGADPDFPDLLSSGIEISEMTPSIGSEISGLQLSSLKDGPRRISLHLPIRDAIEWASYFGRPYVHLTSGSPRDAPEIHLVHRGAGDLSTSRFMSTRNSSVGWHCDSSFEEQPPGTTILYALEVPRSGGDTLFVDQGTAYENLSEGFKERLHGLRAVHSGKEQGQMSLGRGGVVKRDPVTTGSPSFSPLLPLSRNQIDERSEHPIVRTHPATGEKALFVNKSFTRSIVGYKKEESDNLLNFLYDHIAFGADFQARIQWKPGMVIFWDNRLVAHTATMNWNTGERRHLARIALQAEKPYETPYEKKE